jgi:hypothetical protein
MSASGHSRLIDMLATPLRCPLCSESGHRSHVELYEKTPRNGVVEKPAKRAILGAEFGEWKTGCF